MPLLLLLFVLTVLVGCEAMALVDHEATHSAEIDEYIAEATAIQASARADATRIMSTVTVSETQAAQQRGINEQLYATVQAVFPPTQQVVALGEALATPRAIAEGKRWFIKTGMASAVHESDGCSAAPQTQFTPESPRIYATFVAHNIDAGTPLSVSWHHEGEPVLEESFDLGRSASEICLWFFIEPHVIEFRPGFWAVQLYADGFPLESPMTFSITG